MKKVFIVTCPEGTRVITNTLLTNDLREKLDGSVRRTDVEAFVKEAMDEFDGYSFNHKEYTAMITTWCKSIVDYNNLTPYSFHKLYKTDYDVA